MKVYGTKDIRNVAVCGTSGSGKTQLIESILFTEKIINRLGKVEEGNTVSDYDPIEKDRQSSISSSVITFDNDRIKFNFIDTPGYADFIGSTIGAIEVAEVVLLLINPHEGIDVTTRKIWKRAKEKGKAVVIYISFMDNADRDFGNIVEELKSRLNPNMAPVTAPLGKAENFKGIIKLLQNVAVQDGKEVPVPDDLKTKIDEYSESLMDSVAAADDALMEKFLEEGNLAPEDVKKGLSKGLLKGEIVPILCGSSVTGAGVKELLEFIEQYAPSPEGAETGGRKVDPDAEFGSLVFKVESQKHLGQVNYLKVYGGSLKPGTYVFDISNKEKQRVNQITLKRGEESMLIDEVKAGDICSLAKMEDVEINDTLAAASSSEPLEKIDFPEPIVDRGVYPKAKGDEEKVANAFSNIINEDPTLNFGFNGETKEMVLTGMGSLQLELTVRKIRERYGAEVELRSPKISFKETIRKKVDNVRGKYKKQTGGRGQYGDCVIRMEPLERGKGFEFVNEIVGGKIPSNYIPAVEKGITEAMEKGVIAGYPVVDLRIALFDGSYHDVDSSDLAFQVAGSMAFQGAMKQSAPYILEPIMKVRITVGKDYTGAVMGDLNARRGRVLGMEPAGDDQVISAHIPKSSLTSYAEDLRSLTSGEGDYTLEFDHYEETPMDIQQQLIQKYQHDREEGR